MDKQYFKTYYQVNKDKMNIKVICEHCDKMITKGSLNYHQLTPKCQLIKLQKLSCIDKDILVNEI